MWRGTKETLLVLVPAGRMDGDAYKGQAHSLESVGDQGRLSLVPGAGWAAGMRWEGGGRGWCQ